MQSKGISWLLILLIIKLFVYTVSSSLISDQRSRIRIEYNEGSVQEEERCIYGFIKIVRSKGRYNWIFEATSVNGDPWWRGISQIKVWNLFKCFLDRRCSSNRFIASINKIWLQICASNRWNNVSEPRKCSQLNITRWNDRDISKRSWHNSRNDSNSSKTLLYGWPWLHSKGQSNNYTKKYIQCIV